MLITILKNKTRLLLLIILFLLASIFLLSDSSVKAQPPDFFRLNIGQTIEVDRHNECRLVTNIAQPGALDIFIPVKTPTEWAEFRVHHPGHIDLGDCVRLPVLHVSPKRIEYTWSPRPLDVPGIPTPPLITIGTINITNPGAGTLDWSATGNREWIDMWDMDMLVTTAGLAIGTHTGTITPIISGTTTTETDSVIVQAIITGLPIGTHTGTITFTGTCLATGNPAIGSPVIVDVILHIAPPQPSIGIWADPNPIAYNRSTTIHWETSKVRSCTWIAGFSGTAPLSGNRRTGLLTTDTIFTLECAVIGQDPITASVTVVVLKYPVLNVSPPIITHSLTEGTGWTTIGTVSVTNPGAGTLHWSETDDRVWLNATPDSGTTTTGTDFVAVRVTTAGLAIGTHTGTITFTGASPATGSPDEVIVNLTVEAPPADIVCGDGRCEGDETPHNCCSDCGVPDSRCIFGGGWVEWWTCPHPGTTPSSEWDDCSDLNRCVNGVTLVYGCRNAQCVHIENTCEHGCCVGFCRGFGTGWDGRCVGDSCHCEQRTR